MERISRFQDREIVSKDGNLIGRVKGFTFTSIDNWNVTGVTMNLEKESHEELGKKKPFMGALKVDIGVDTITAVSDNILLNRNHKDMRPLLKNHIESKNIANIIEKEVVDSQGKDIGVIEDVMVDVSKWMLPSILVKLDKDTHEMLRIEKAPDIERRVTIPMGTISSIGDKVMLNLNKEALGSMVQRIPVKTI